MRFLASVCAFVDIEGAPLDKALATAIPVATIGPVITMDAFVSLEVGFAVEALGTSAVSIGVRDRVRRLRR